MPAFNVDAASITVLRLGQSAPPELIWTPATRCAWRMRLGVGSGLFSLPASCSPESVVPAEWAGWPLWTHRVVAGVTAAIVSGDRELADRLADMHRRRLRLMAWTQDEVVGRRRPTGALWTRVTVDELVHEFTCRHGAGWVTLLSSQVLSPIVDFAAPPTGL